MVITFVITTAGMVLLLFFWMGVQFLYRAYFAECSSDERNVTLCGQCRACASQPDSSCEKRP